jgi:protein-tyrosine phosphatase
MVCLGNICRSPLAEGIMKHKIAEHKLDWTVDSAGTGSWHLGSKPDSRSIAVASAHDINITQQRARQFEREDFQHFDKIFAMDSENYQNIIKLASNDQDKNKLALIMNEANPGLNQSVPDPYWDDDGFEKVYQMLDEACSAFVKKHG